MEVVMNLGARIASLRRARGESLQDVADAVGVTKTHIWELERGRSTNPTFNVIRGLADHFGVSIASLVGEDINAADASEQLGRMFRLAGKLGDDDRKRLEGMIEVFLKHQENSDIRRS
jgi:transcriptional regulator with XRE-family HTH domain